MTEKRNIFILTGCTMVVSSLLFGLYSESPLSRPITPSSFTRLIDTTTYAQLINTYELGDYTYYIAGKTNDLVYIGNYKKPFEINQINLSTTQQEDVTVALKGVDTLKALDNFRIFIDAETFFVTNGVMPIILKGNTNSWTATPIFKNERNYFVDILPISQSSFALRSYSNASKSFQLGRQSLCDSPFFTIKQGILKKQIDGLIDVHGYIRRDNTNKQLVYLYAYRNEYIVMDSVLNILSTGKTIDTFSTAAIKIEINTKTGESMVANPPTAVNGVSYIYNNKLYIQSNLLSRNEDPKAFLNNSVIDIYDVNKKEYPKTIYIPNIKTDRITDFRIDRNQLLAVYKNKLLVFTLTEKKRKKQNNLTHK